MFKRKRDVKTLTIEELEKSATKGHKEAQKELARRLLEGDGVDKDEAKAVSLLEDCVAHGDAVAMVMLAKCCALGHGMEYNAERAEALVSEAADKGNDEAQYLMRFIQEYQEKDKIDLAGLWNAMMRGRHITHYDWCLFQGALIPIARLDESRLS